MSGKTAKMLRKFTNLTRQGKKEFRQAHKKFKALPDDLREKYRNVIINQTTKVKLKMESLKHV